MKLPEFIKECKICGTKTNWGAAIPNKKHSSEKIYFLCEQCYEKLTVWIITEQIDLEDYIQEYKEKEAE